MRTTRPASMIIKLLIALLVVLLIGFVPLRELLYPRSATEVAAPLLTALPVMIPSETSAAAPTLPTRTPVSGSPEPVIEKSDLIWIVNRVDGVLYRIDPDQNEVTGQTILAGDPGAITSGEGGVWVVLSSGNRQNSIVRLNPNDMSVAATIPIYSGQVTSLEAGAGAVWAGVDHSPVDGAGGGSIVRIDPHSNEISAVIPRSGAAAQFTSYAQTLLVLEQQERLNTISRVETNSLQVLSYPAAKADVMPATCCSHVSLGPAGIWVTAHDGNDAYLYQLDPSSGSVLASVALGAADAGQAVAVETGEASVLVWLSNGTLLQVDPFLQQIVNQVQIEPGLGKIHLRPGTIWIENESEAKVYCIDAQRLEVMEVFLMGSKAQPTAHPTPTLLAGTESVCEARYPTRLTKGAKAVVNLEPPVPNRLRSEPDARAEITGQIEPGEIINLIDGPVCANGWVWWYVQSRQSGIMGWTSEGDRNDYWLSPSE